MRLQQLMLEYPEWSSHEFVAAVDSRGKTYSVRIDNVRAFEYCFPEKLLDDPRYKFTYGEEHEDCYIDGGSIKVVGVIIVEFEEDNGAGEGKIEC